MSIIENIDLNLGIIGELGQVVTNFKRFISHELLPSSGQTLALAEPEARLYNHQPPVPRPRPGANVSIGYISAISQRIELKFCMIVI